MVCASRIAGIALISCVLLGAADARPKNRGGLNAKAAATEDTQQGSAQLPENAQSKIDQGKTAVNDTTQDIKTTAGGAKNNVQGSMPFGSVDTSQVKTDVQTKVSNLKSGNVTVTKDDVKAKVGTTETEGENEAATSAVVSLPSRIARPRTYRSSAYAAAPAGLALGVLVAGAFFCL